ncbi:rhomboid protease, ROM6 [Cyclospora cayetanensis]|uniref:Rhomboid protease, ROM6 n=1 Tax=Cyclospora cayetanensis TaxID=88456 RepID=A0A1D3DAK1_9EIME|nr:rhomboid protease, ROM6 [Cyclospora cayetanensis]
MWRPFQHPGALLAPGETKILGVPFSFIERVTPIPAAATAVAMLVATRQKAAAPTALVGHTGGTQLWAPRGGVRRGFTVAAGPLRLHEHPPDPSSFLSLSMGKGPQRPHFAMPAGSSLFVAHHHGKPGRAHLSQGGPQGPSPRSHAGALRFEARSVYPRALVKRPPWETPKQIWLPGSSGCRNLAVAPHWQTSLRPPFPSASQHRQRLVQQRKQQEQTASSAEGRGGGEWASLGSRSSIKESGHVNGSIALGFPRDDPWWVWGPLGTPLVEFSPLKPQPEPMSLRQQWHQRHQLQDSGCVRPSVGSSSAEASKLLLYSCGGIFLLWRVAAAASNSSSLWGSHLMRLLMNHFAASREALLAGRLHTIFTASLSHAGLAHLLMNCLLLQLLLQQLESVLSGRDVWGLLLLSSLLGVSTHVISSPLPVLGASSLACCLLWVEGVCRSRDTFMTILPLPGLMLTALQLSQLNLLVNAVCYLISRVGRGRISMLLRGVSWPGHLGGIAAGWLYTEYKRRIEGDPRWGSFLNLSYTFSASDWQNTRADISDSLKILGLQTRLLFCEEDERRLTRIRLEQLKRQRQQRRAFGSM